MRVMQRSFGWPFTSALQDPHLPALQFQRTARSGACVAWMRCTTSSTTIPGSSGTTYSTCSPPEPSQPWSFLAPDDRGLARCDLLLRLVLTDELAQLRRRLRDRLGGENEAPV